MSQIILPGFRSNVPGVTDEIAKPDWRLPLSVASESGFNLDFTPLLLFDQVILDSTTWNYLRDSDQPFLAPIRESVRVLREEGSLKTVAFQEVLDQHNEQISSQVGEN